MVGAPAADALVPEAAVAERVSHAAEDGVAALDAEELVHEPELPDVGHDYDAGLGGGLDEDVPGRLAELSPARESGEEVSLSGRELVGAGPGGA